MDPRLHMSSRRFAYIMWHIGLFSAHSWWMIHKCWHACTCVVVVLVMLVWTLEQFCVLPLSWYNMEDLKMKHALVEVLLKVLLNFIFLIPPATTSLNHQGCRKCPKLAFLITTQQGCLQLLARSGKTSSNCNEHSINIQTAYFVCNAFKVACAVSLVINTNPMF